MMQSGIPHKVLRGTERGALVAIAAAGVLYAGFETGRIGGRWLNPADTARPMDTAAPSDSVARSAAPPDAAAEPIPPLFGTPPVAEAPPAPPPAAAAAVSADYMLQGVTMTGGQRWAMIQSDAGVILSREGDTLSGDDRIVSIRSDAVMVRTGDRLFAIRFADDADGDPDGDARLALVRESLAADLDPAPDTDAPPPRLTTPPPPAPAPARREVEDVRPSLPLPALRRAVFAPDAMSSLRLDRARLSDGGIGWRIRWLQDNPLAEAAGLRRGDVLRAVNGIAVTDAAALQGLLPMLGRLSEITVDYERGDTTIRAVIPLLKGPSP